MKLKIVMYIILVLFLVVSVVSAHPGKLDGNGGHTCRTNCEKWGLKNGEYHYHTSPKLSSTPEPTITATPTPEPTITATPTPEPTITATPTSDYSTVKSTDTQNQVIDKSNQTYKNISQGENSKNWFERLINWLFN